MWCFVVIFSNSVAVKQHYNKVSESSCTRKLNFEACIVSL